MTRAHWTFDAGQAHLEVPRTRLGRGRPGLRVEANRVTGDRGQALLARLMLGPWVLHWGMVHGHVLRWARGEANPSALWPWLRAHDIDRLSAKPDPAGAWLRLFAGWLRDARCGPLYPGTWRLRYHDTLEETLAERERDAFERDPWGSVLGLRRASHEDASRVKMWRKRARDGALPPILVWNLPPLHVHVVLDGHDRLLAANLEGVTPTYLELTQVTAPDDQSAHQQAAWEHVARAHERGDPSRFSQGSVDHLNRTLLAAYAAPALLERVRCWPLRGGVERWLDEIEVCLDERTDADDRGVLLDMLWPRTHPLTLAQWMD